MKNQMIRALALGIALAFPATVLSRTVRWPNEKMPPPA